MLRKKVLQKRLSIFRERVCVLERFFKIINCACSCLVLRFGWRCCHSVCNLLYWSKSDFCILFPGVFISSFFFFVKRDCKTLLDRVSWRVVSAEIGFFSKVCHVLIGFKNSGCVIILNCVFSGFHLKLGETRCSSFEWTSIISLCSNSLHLCTILPIHLLVCQKLNMFFLDFFILFLIYGKSIWSFCENLCELLNIIGVHCSMKVNSIN